MKYKNVKKEEELKGKVGRDWFSNFDDTPILGNIDFCIAPKLKLTAKEEGLQSLLWAEAKTGDFDVVSMFAQLIITIGKERTYDKNFPPAFLGVFDYKKIVFVPYNEVVDIFFTNDFNWNVAPSNHDTKEFEIIKSRIEGILQKQTYKFDFLEDEKELKFFIKNNIALASEGGKMLIDKNNFVSIYLRWLTQVKPFINFDWVEGKKQNILDSDFFLADLFVDDKGTVSMEDDTPIKEELFVVFKKSHYEIAKENIRSLFNATIDIGDKDKYEHFWKKYKRSPVDDFQQYIIDRRDLLMPQDIRERKGAFFTPQIWVELSQKYIGDTLGENWQEEYTIWDCAAGTGNLLAGLTNKYNIWASTLDMADVNVMKDRIANGANLLQDHVFQFDFLNDDFTKLPHDLQNIVNDEEKRKKLVVYINPPYAEATSSKTVTGTGENKGGVTTQFKINDHLKPKIGNASNEIFALFMANIYEKIPDCILGQFSKLKFVNGTNFKKFKDFFLADYIGGFVVPAETFDNVKGKFPIGFTIWNTAIKSKINTISTAVFDKKGNFIGTKNFYGELPNSINKWFVKFQSNSIDNIGLLSNYPPDFQNQAKVFIKINQMARGGAIKIVAGNLLPITIYIAVRHCIEATWLNDRDQFLYPNENWENDFEFQNDCLAYALFHGQNRITSNEGTNHWIPFTEQEVNAKAKFTSAFMTDFIRGTLKSEGAADLFGEAPAQRTTPLVFSPEATAVFDAGKALWTYYHEQFNVNVNASLYDIREHFQGRNTAGKMNHKSEDKKYMELITALRAKLSILANTIAPKVYEYEFLKE